MLRAGYFFFRPELPASTPNAHTRTNIRTDHPKTLIPTSNLVTPSHSALRGHTATHVLKRFSSMRHTTNLNSQWTQTHTPNLISRENTPFVLQIITGIMGRSSDTWEYYVGTYRKWRAFSLEMRACDGRAEGGRMLFVSRVCCEEYI